MTHTPGPWGKFVSGGQITIFAGEDVPMSDIAFIGATRRNYQAPVGNDLANGHLIAAAPDLLEACRQALERMEALDDSRCEAAEACRKAIYRAEGL